MNAYRRGVRIAITIAPKAAKALDRLLATGLYGRTRAGVAQRFVYEGLRDAPRQWSGLSAGPSDGDGARTGRRA